MKLLLAGPGTGKTTRIKELIKGQEDLSKVLVLSFTNATIQDLLSSFAESKIEITEKNCMTLHKYALKVNHQKELHILNSNEVEILEFYAKKLSVNFEDLCKTLRCITFEQMITQTISYIKANPVYLKELIGDVGLLIVDEFQDFNPIERELISLLSNFSKESIILGDDDQCIYEFKDADTDGIINLFNDPAVDNIQHHNICYRCPDSVVEACSHLIQKNLRRVKKDWKKCGKSGKVEFQQLRTQEDTGNFILNKIEEILQSDPEASVMVLSAVEFATESILTILNNKSIEVTNHWNSTVDYAKMQSIWKIRTILGNKKLLNLLFLIHPLIKANRKALTNINEIISKKLDFDALISLVEKESYTDSTFVAFLKSNPSFTDVISKEEYSFLSPYINEISLDRDLEQVSRLISEPKPFNPKGINVLSIHKSKGLQADYVFMVGIVEGIIPNVLRGIDTVEAQRRLLFVGMSRTKKTLYIVSTIEWDGRYVNKVDKKQFSYEYKTKKYFGRTSSFVSELNL